MNELQQHEFEDSRRFEVLERVIFGDEETGDMGMKAKVDEMHTILVQARGVSGFFSGVRGGITLLLAAATLVAWLKGWVRL